MDRPAIVPPVAAATSAPTSAASLASSAGSPSFSNKRVRASSSYESDLGPYQMADQLKELDATKNYAAIRAEYVALRERCAAMEAQLHALKSPSMSGSQPPSSFMHKKKVSTLESSGAVVRLSADELAAMKQIFALFDTDGSGTINAHDLQALHQKLGEPITDKEAAEMVEQIAQGRDSISFENFVQLWDGSHPSQRVDHDADTVPHFALDELRDKKRQWYLAKFKFVKARLTSNPAVARIFTKLEGVPPSLEFRVRFYYDSPDGAEPIQISAWHDIPYKNADGSFNMICEVPKYTRRKFEIATGEPYNAIKQDVKNGVLREFGYGDALFNYGCLPQTFEDPAHISPETGFRGDADPLDIYDLGSRMWSTGSIIQVKILGVLAMIDCGETDWKIIAINTEDPFASFLNDIDDVAVYLPGAMESLHRWLKFYKSPLINSFAFEGRVQNRAFALRIIEETHQDWSNLVQDRGQREVEK